MSKGNDWYGGHKPIPPFPEKINKRKAKRNRVKIPKDIPEGYPVLSREEFKLVIPHTSTAKGIGRKVCVEEGKHDWVAEAPGWFPGRVFHILCCRRCGEKTIDGDIW